MVLYTCEICNKTFKQKGHYRDHVEKKKKPCQQILTNPHKTLTKPSQNLTNFLQKPSFSDNSLNFNNDLNIEPDEKSESSEINDETINSNYCLYCGHIFNRKDNLKRHIDKFCKIKKQKDDETKKQNEIIMAQMIELKKLLENQNKQIENQTKEIQEIKKKKPVSKVVINNTNNTLNTGNTLNTNNINLMAHGKEDFSKIELKSILECLCNENFQDIVPNMVKQIYIDKTYPEFHNFKVLDLSRNKSEYYNGKDWVVGKADDGLLKIFENVNTALIEPFDKNNIDKTIKFIKNNEELKKKYQWIDWSKNYCKNLFKDSDKEYVEDRNKILNELKLIFYNNRDEILKIDY